MHYIIALFKLAFLSICTITGAHAQTVTSRGIQTFANQGIVENQFSLLSAEVENLRAQIMTCQANAAQTCPAGQAVVGSNAADCSPICAPFVLDESLQALKAELRSLAGTVSQLRTDMESLDAQLRGQFESRLAAAEASMRTIAAQEAGTIRDAVDRLARQISELSRDASTASAALRSFTDRFNQLNSDVQSLANRVSRIESSQQHGGRGCSQSHLVSCDYYFTTPNAEHNSVWGTTNAGGAALSQCKNGSWHKVFEVCYVGHVGDSGNNGF